MFEGKNLAVLGLKKVTHVWIQCKTCKKTLSNGNWSDRGTDVYCNACYEKNFVDDETKQQIFELERYIQNRNLLA